MDMDRVLAKELESKAVIRFQDCDPFGHLNNARYIDYFLNAREDHLASYYGFRIFEHSQSTNASWVVTKTHIAYLYPAKVMEEVVIQTCLINMSDSGLVIEALMFDKDKRHLKALLWMEFTYVSLATGRVQKHPDDLMQFFESVLVNRQFQPDGFNERIQQAKREYRRQAVEATAV
jgi:YbgC/YbaW family acyl-CoA thioester hydrolase